MLAPVVLAVRLTALPDAEAPTEAAESALIAAARPVAMEEVVVPEPLQLKLSAWPLAVIVLVPES